MMYREFLVMRKALAWFFGLIAVVSVLAWLLAAMQPGGAHTRGGTAANFILAASWTAVFFAAFAGVALGNASREPARVMWVLPVERWRGALEVIGVDAIAMVLAFAGVAGIVLLEVWCIVLLDPAHSSILWTFSAIDIAHAVAFLFAVYGWSALAGVLGRKIAYAGLAVVPAGLIWQLIATSQTSLGAALRTAIVLDPFAVAVFTSQSGDLQRCYENQVCLSLAWLTPAGGTAVMLALALGTCALAVALWQRAEVLA